MNYICLIHIYFECNSKYNQWSSATQTQYFHRVNTSMRWSFSNSIYCMICGVDGFNYIKCNQRRAKPCSATHCTEHSTALHTAMHCKLLHCLHYTLLHCFHCTLHCTVSYNNQFTSMSVKEQRLNITMVFH